MKEISTKKLTGKQGKDLKQTSLTGLKSSLTTSKKTQNKETFLPKALQKYTELPSLRYSVTPNQTDFYMRKSGPLRLNLGCENNYSKEKTCEKISEDFSTPVGGLEKSAKSSSAALNGDAPPVRRVHFAELPPKSNSFVDFTDFNEKNAERGEEKEETENWLKKRVDISCTDSNSVSSSCFARRGLPFSASFPSSIKISEFKVRNSGELSKSSSSTNSILKEGVRGHDTAKYRRGILNQASSPIPPILRAAKDGNDEDLAEILRKAALFGISPEELNAVDSSGRTALSYIASNGTLKNLKGILKLSKIDVNKHDNEGNTPLHFASQAGQVEAINYMLSICPNLEIDARNALGFTPLMKAALQGRTKCAKLLLFAGASPNLRDSGRGLKAEQWAKFCGRHSCAEVIEKFTREKLLDRNMSCGRWESEPELLDINPAKQSQIIPNSTSSNIKLKLRKAFRTISHPGSEVSGKSYSVVSQLTTVALCASSPVLQSSVSPSIKSLMRPLSVPKLEVTLASNCVNGESANSTLQHSSSATSIKEKINSSILSNRHKKKNK